MDANTQRLMMGAAGGGGGTGQAVYVEDVFSTWLYTGNGSTQTITNGIDLAGKGGLVWIKSRSDLSVSGTEVQQPYHFLSDTTKTSRSFLSSNTTNAFASLLAVSSFNSTGFSLDQQGDGASLGGRGNFSGVNYASWTFRKAAKFFDVVTYTGTGVARSVNHSLGSTPGAIIIKRTDTTADWIVYHRSTGTGQFLYLNTLDAAIASSKVTATNSSTFSLPTDSNVNAGGGSFVAYLFAHDAGGFGDTGADNVISCGSYTGNSSTNGPTITLGWEPQWIMLKRTSGTAGWYVYDNMRGVRTGGVDSNLLPNSSQPEDSSFDYIDFNATGFKLTTTSNDHNGNGDTYIYIAIRRGPMKTPTDATKVFSALARTGTGATVTTSAGLAPDLAIINYLPGGGDGHGLHDRLRGQYRIDSTNNGAEGFGSAYPKFDQMTGVQLITSQYNSSGQSMIDWYFRRAPGFFDVVAYTGTGAARTVSHNLGVAPELIIFKNRTLAGGDWTIYSVALGNTKAIYLNYSFAAQGPNNSFWNSTTPTSTVFSLGTGADANNNGDKYVAYLFASCPGVSKVGSYTGTGTTLQVNCGFTAGARFVLIKRTDSTGDWYVWDTARGIVSGNDPYILLNSTAAEVTNTDYIDPYSAGFEISSTAPAAINASGGSYIYLAIA